MLGQPLTELVRRLKGTSRKVTVIKTVMSHHKLWAGRGVLWPGNGMKQVVIHLK